LARQGFIQGGITVTFVLKRLIAGSAIAVMALGGVALSTSVASATETTVFNATASGPLTENGVAIGEARAVALATVAANAAGFFNCPTHEITNITIAPPPANTSWRVSIALTCTR
jgi:hypothetical protein